MTRRVLPVVIIFFLVFGALYAGRMFLGGGGMMMPPPLPVTAVKAEQGPLARSLRAVGTLIAVRQVTVAPEVDGRIVALRFEPGAKVGAGDPLVQLNDGPERGDLTGYRGAVRLAEIEVNRARDLLARRAVAQAQLDEAQSRLDTARGAVARTEAEIDRRLIRAPFAGVLGIRQVDPGSYVQAGQAIVTLTDLDTLYVNFSLAEQNAGDIAVGQAIDLSVDAYSGRTFRATVTTVEPQVSQSTRTIQVQGTLDNREGLLRPGMFADVSLLLPEQPDAITIPETAVVPSPYGDSVYVVRAAQAQGGQPQQGAPQGAQPGHVLDRVFVDIGRRVAGRVAVAKGVAPGDLVVTAGQVNLSPGMPVAPAPPKTETADAAPPARAAAPAPAK